MKQENDETSIRVDSKKEGKKRNQAIIKIIDPRLSRVVSHVAMGKVRTERMIINTRPTNKPKR